MEAVHGCRKTIQYTVDEPCDGCKATGKSFGGKKKHCSACHGKGYVGVTLQGGMKRRVECDVCQGEGRLSPVCGECKGSGVVKAQRQVEVKIPAGVNEATNVRLLHMGDSGRRGGKKGNLRIRIHVRPDAEGNRRRDGNDIHTDLHLSLASAVLGGAHTVATVDGDEAVQLTPGVQHGQTMTLQGKGVRLVNSTSQQRGDHHIHLHVRIPQPHEMSEEQLQLLRQTIALQRQQQQQQQQHTAQRQSQSRAAAGSSAGTDGAAPGGSAADESAGGSAAGEPAREVEELTTSKTTDSAHLDKTKRRKLQQQTAAARRGGKKQRSSAAQREERRRMEEEEDEEEDDDEDDPTAEWASSEDAKAMMDEWDADMQEGVEEIERQATSKHRRKQNNRNS